VVLDATRSMHLELQAFNQAFSGLAGAMQEECLLETGEPCLKVGFLVFGGYYSIVGGGSLFEGITGSGSTALEKGLGIAGMAGSPGEMRALKDSVEGIGYSDELEPWVDALIYAAGAGSAGKIGWRNSSKKAVLLITSETDTVSAGSTGAASSALNSNRIGFYAAVRNLGVGSDSPLTQAQAFGGNAFGYEIPTESYSDIRLSDSGMPLTDIFKIVVKDIVQDSILNSRGKDYCLGTACSQCQPEPGGS